MWVASALLDDMQMRMLARAQRDSARARAAQGVVAAEGYNILPVWTGQCYVPRRGRTALVRSASQLYRLASRMDMLSGYSLLHRTNPTQSGDFSCQAPTITHESLNPLKPPTCSGQGVEPFTIRPGSRPHLAAPPQWLAAAPH